MCAYTHEYIYICIWVCVCMNVSANAMLLDPPRVTDSCEPPYMGAGN